MMMIIILYWKQIKGNSLTFRKMCIWFDGKVISAPVSVLKVKPLQNYRSIKPKTLENSKVSSQSIM